MVQNGVRLIDQRLDEEKARLCVSFRPGATWTDPGFVTLWLEHRQRDQQMDIDSSAFAELLQWVESLGIIADYLDSRQQTIRIRANAFVKMISAFLSKSLETKWIVSEGLDLYLRLYRFAWQLFECKDIRPFACPSDVTWQEVLSTCFLILSSEEDVLPKWASGTCTFTATWMPGWTNASIRALRMLYVTEAEQVWKADWHDQLPWECAAHGYFMLEIWIWTILDDIAHHVLQSVDLTEESIERKTTYRVMYRGEEEVLHLWEQALVDIQNRSFSADGWLIARKLRQKLQGSGWQREWLLDRSGVAYYRLEFELCPPSPEGASVDWELRYDVVHSDFLIRASLAEWWKQKERVWRIGRDLLIEPDCWILPLLWQAGQIFSPILRSLQAAAPSRCWLAPDEVVELAQHALAELVQLGITVRTPDFTSTHIANIRIRVQVGRSRQKSTSRGNAHTQPIWFDANQLVEFDWSVVIDDKELSRQEFEQIVQQRTPYVHLGGAWRLIPVEEIIKQIQDLGANQLASSVSMLDLSRMLLLQEEEPVPSTIPLEVEYEEEAFSVDQVMHALKFAHVPEVIETPVSFRGELRHYQAIGYSWLVKLREIGCGACLADDMGLGKTIQVLAYLLRVKETGENKGIHLLICPTSLLQNWKTEISRFAPGLKLYVHHGSQRNQLSPEGISPFEQACANYDLLMTTYATVVRDLEQFQGTSWDTIIVDEAQNIKNSDTKQSFAVRSLQAFHRIALTGTPVENRLDELWSIFQFINPGYLGSLSWFRKTFSDPISQNPNSQTAHRLQQLLRPVLMRRRKTEPSIQIELPEKWEVRQYAALTSEQAAIYQSIVNQLFDGIEERSKMSRRGQILAALVRLKQACDHPCLVVGGSSQTSRSGKLKLLMDLLDDVFDEGENALVFTQFRDMGEILCNAIQEKQGIRPQFLHGGLSAHARGQIVSQFQSGHDRSSVLVLSLKAGGVGLNLTRANHVFHFDRWWNPAVEDQATDRAFRIGQVKDVQVHKLVCLGTLEERIDALITTKRQLSQAVVGGGAESWVTELDDAALKALFDLDKQTIIEEDE